MAKHGKFNDEESKPTKFIAYNEEIFYGHPINAGITTKNFTLNTRLLFALQSILASNTVSIVIKKITAIWIPLIEPGSSAVLKISASYLASKSYENHDSEDIVEVEGKLTESHKLVLYPTHPVIKASDKKLVFPWVVNISCDEMAGCEERSPIGILKVWCQIKLSMLSAIANTQHSLYKAPEVHWENKHHPYYVPFYRIKKIRGICPIIWRDTSQYKSFSQEVLRHVDSLMIPDEDHLMIMQTMSLEDVDQISIMTKHCHVMKGGFCNCGDTVAKFLSSVIKNNDPSYHGISRRFDEIAGSILTGKIKGMNPTRNVLTN